MRIAYLECFSGISGDMFLGALVDAGVPAALLEKTVAGLAVRARLEISRVLRSGISATKVDVWVDGEKDLPREEYWERQGAGHFLTSTLIIPMRIMSTGLPRMSITDTRIRMLVSGRVARSHTSVGMNMGTRTGGG